MTSAPGQWPLLSLLLLPIFAYLLGAVLSVLLERQFTNVPPVITQDGL